MKAIKFFILSIVALLPLLTSCNGGPAAEGKPFDELPVLAKGDVLAFFKAIPAQDLPARIATPEQREAYFEKFSLMSEDGALADGPGYSGPTTENAVFWSDYLDYDEMPVEDMDLPHPYANLYVYAGAESGKLFGILKSGAYVDGDVQVNPEKYYWFDSAKAKMSAAKLSLKPAYTEDDITADPLITYGAGNLFYAIKNGGVENNYYDRGMEVYIRDVGSTGVVYDWDGVSFVRSTGKPIPCIYNWGFGNFSMGSKVPYDIPGYATNFVSASEYEHTYAIVKSGETEPSLVLVTDAEDEIFDIEVCSPAYSNPYGIYPGMPFSDFLTKVNEIGALFPEPPYISYTEDAEDEFVSIYTGMDEDFYYKVDKAFYAGDESFREGAVIARVCVINAVG